MMSEKRFDTNGYYINDTFSDGRKWLVNEVEAKEIVDVMNNLDMKARERSKALSKLQKKVNEQQAIIEAKDSLLSILSKENEQLRQGFNELLAVHTKIMQTLDDEFVSKALLDGGDGV